MKLKPWREIITPHDTVLQGTFLSSTFAADLSKVAAKTAPDEYQDPVLFFERTFITEGIDLLLNTVIKRLSGKGGDPVVQLQTAFGGGKTHAMLAVYHLSRGEAPAKKLLGIPALLDKARITTLPRANVAVLDGNAMSPSEPRKRGSVKVNTLWGEMAFQLGGEEGYQLLAKADQEGTSPGKEILAALFTKFAPCVILMDETVAYIRQFEEHKT
jgi:predicted AAA+ superfamily ATPase